MKSVNEIIDRKIIVQLSNKLIRMNKDEKIFKKQLIDRTVIGYLITT